MGMPEQTIVVEVVEKSNWWLEIGLAIILLFIPVIGAFFIGKCKVKKEKEKNKR